MSDIYKYWPAAAPAKDTEIYVLVWVTDPVTKYRYCHLKPLSEVKPTDERVDLGIRR